MTPKPYTEDQRPYTAHGGHAAMWKSRSKEIILSGPAGTGKSRAVLEKLHFCCMKYPGIRVLIIRKTRESMSESVLVTFEDKVLPVGSPLLSGATRANRHAYTYPNKSIIVIAGLLAHGKDQRAKVMSTDFDIIYEPEATDILESEHEKLTTRLRNHAMPYQQIIGDCNPDSPRHWIWLRAQRHAIQLIETTHKDNPKLWNGKDWTPEGRDYLDTLRALTGYERDRLLDGKWVQAQGLVYDVWSDGPIDGNVTEDAEYQADGGLVYWGIDDGYAGSIDPTTRLFTAESHPRVFLLIQERADGRLCVFYEHYKILTMEEEQIAEVSALPYSFPAYGAIDKSAAALRGRLHNAGHYTQSSPNTVDESIKVLRRMLAPDANGWRRILVHPRCTLLRSEMVSYRIDPITEKPIKQFDHGPDALRYLAWTKRFGDP